MESVTLEGPVVILPAEDYRNLLDRITRLERVVSRLARLLEDVDDVQAMREAEAEYQAGDRASFDELLAEIEAEAGSVSGLGLFTKSLTSKS